ncbi:MAG: hypothetical protein H6867_05185 [Rhodospirillales bacterium]|nr:hypothetical protein [Rhodospirillales bacterium]MCB9994922.1 hypothetical protein [Rhodospirillales bacterium]
MSGPLIADQTPVASALDSMQCRLVSSDGAEGSLALNQLAQHIQQGTGMQVSTVKGPGLHSGFNECVAGIERPALSADGPQTPQPDLTIQRSLG